MNTPRTLTITAQPDWQQHLRMCASQADHALQTGSYQGEYLNFADPSDFFMQLGGNRWQLLDYLLQNTACQGMDVQELALRLGKDSAQVHQDAMALVELGLLQTTGHTSFMCPYAEIVVDMVFPCPRQQARGAQATALMASDTAALLLLS